MMTRGIYWCVIVACVAFIQSPTLRAQDDAAAEPDASATGNLKVTVDSDEADPAETWKGLLARRLEIFERLQELKKEFEAAETNDEKRKVRDEYVGLIREFEVEVYPDMLELAASIYEKNADDLDAGEIVMKEAFNENNFDVSGKIATALIAADRKTQAVLTMAGVSQFALHNFGQAHAILSEAQKMNRLDARYETYIDAAQRYVDLWQKEQEIRAKEAALEGDAALPKVEFDTSKGKIVFELFEDHCPNTVANIINLVEGGKYDGIKFHRVINGFMAQGGDPNTLDDDPSNDGYGGPGYSIDCECYRDDARMHFRGSMSMAHSGPNTGGSQFFITHLPTEWLNPRTEPQKGGHTVFGRVIEGMDVAASIRRGDKINKATVLRKRPHEYKAEINPDEEPESDETESSDEKKETE